MSDYEFNNTYQYVIAREDVHLSWLEAALVDSGGNPDVVEEPHIGRARRRKAGLPATRQET